MMVPEASVHENDGLQTGKNDVWFSRQPGMQAESKALSMKELPSQEFRPRIALPDAAHYPASFRL
jgi:hypothetical protein